MILNLLPSNTESGRHQELATFESGAVGLFQISVLNNALFLMYTHCLCS
jgi:hypothetical protein